MQCNNQLSLQNLRQHGLPSGLKLVFDKFFYNFNLCDLCFFQRRPSHTLCNYIFLTVELGTMQLLSLL